MKLLLAPFLCGSALAALAAEPPVAALGNLTATGILGWYAWHTATRTVPQLVEDFRLELGAGREEHRADRDLFLREMAAQRAQSHADRTATVAALGELTAAIREGGGQ